MKTRNVIIGSTLFLTAVGVMYFFYHKNKPVDTNIDWQIATKPVTPLPEEQVPVFNDSDSTSMLIDTTKYDTGIVSGSGNQNTSYNSYGYSEYGY